MSINFGDRKTHATYSNVANSVTEINQTFCKHSDKQYFQILIPRTDLMLSRPEEHG
jgi:hypothetical protein